MTIFTFNICVMIKKKKKKETLKNFVSLKWSKCHQLTLEIRSRYSCCNAHENMYLIANPKDREYNISHDALLHDRTNKFRSVLHAITWKCCVWVFGQWGPGVIYVHANMGELTFKVSGAFAIRARLCTYTHRRTIS